MARKPTPAIRHLRFHLTHTGTAEDSHYIDVAKSLSEVNRRLYRQGKEYHIGGITFHTTSTCFIKVGTAPNSWVTREAWKRGKKKWDEMNRQALDGDLKSRGYPRWHDYKVYLIDDMRTDIDKPGPMDIDSNIVDPGEWVYSEYESPDGTLSSDSYTAHLLGDHNGTSGAFVSVGLVKSYAETRANMSASFPQVDTDGDDDPLANLFDAGTQHDEILEDLEADNDQPPYASSSSPSLIGEQFVGGEANMPAPQVVGLASTSYHPTGGGTATTYVGPFSAICGLIEIETTSANDGDIIDVLIELVPGSYKGVAANAI